MGLDIRESVKSSSFSPKRANIVCSSETTLALVKFAGHMCDNYVL